MFRLWLEEKCKRRKYIKKTKVKLEDSKEKSMAYIYISCFIYNYIVVN